MGAIALLLLSGAAIGCSFGDGRGPAIAGLESCDTCGVPSLRVLGLVETLQSHPRWRTRDDAAHELREFDWRCHPEILLALSSAMLTDCEEEVREEAAESLAKIEPSPCTPEVHAALARAVECERDFCARKWAKRGLSRLGKRCEGACATCEVMPTGYEPAIRAPLMGRFLLPRNAAFMIPGGRARMPADEPAVIFEAGERPVEMLERQRDATSEPELVVPNDPLENLPRIEALPDPNLPQPLIDPRTTPPPAIEGASPFLAPPRAEIKDRVEERKVARASGGDSEQRQPERPRGLIRRLLGGRS